MTNADKAKLSVSTELDDLTAMLIAVGVEEADEATTLAAWQRLVDTWLAWRLQGFFGRTAQRLIDAGLIHAKGDGK